jgi:hypothetical protein
MKKFTSLLIGVSLALAGVAFAQQPEETPGPGKKQAKTEKAETKTHAEKTAKPEATAKQTGAMKETGAAATEPGGGKAHKAKAEKSATATETGVSGQTGGTTTTETGAGKAHKAKAVEKTTTATGTETGVSGQTGGTTTTETGAGKAHKAKAVEKTTTATGAETSASVQPTASAAPGAKHQAGQREKATKAAGANAKALPSATPATAATASAAPSVAAAASAAPSVAGANTAAAVKKADPQKVQQVKQQVQQIKQQHVNFKAQPRPDKVPAVTFNVNYRIEGSDRWQGPQYEVYRSYHPERHDRGWYHSRYQRVELISGGYYYWNNGYWIPAWGYDPSAEYYAYDAPIYVGHRAEPPDRVIADVQAALQEMGYYTGEVDGLIGPLTREALIAYQSDQGLTTTAVIDEPTLDSLNMG